MFKGVFVCVVNLVVVAFAVCPLIGAALFVTVAHALVLQSPLLSLLLAVSLTRRGRCCYVLGLKGLRFTGRCPASHPGIRISLYDHVPSNQGNTTLFARTF